MFSGVLRSLIPVDEVLAEKKSQSEDRVKAVPTDDLQVAVDRQTYAEHCSDAQLIYCIAGYGEAAVFALALHEVHALP